MRFLFLAVLLLHFSLMAEDVILSVDQIADHAKAAALQNNRTRIHEIDILTQIFYMYQDDPALDKGSEYIIEGSRFASGHFKAKPFFENGEKQKSPQFLEPNRPIPKIEYGNFQKIALYKTKELSRLGIFLKKTYEQEIPYTFGATVLLQKEIKGTLRSFGEREITEVVFDQNQSVLFSPPGIAFFIPEIWVKIAAIRREGDELFGYVIGYPKKMPGRVMAVRYNLTTCSKTAIRSFQLSPEQFKHKLNQVNFYSWAE